MKTRDSLATGAALAVLAALTFGVTTPLVAMAGKGAGPLATASLLYLGACLSSVLLGRIGKPSGAPLRRAQFWRLLGVALAGAGLAPTLLAWGLQRTGATSGSLLLNLEAVFTALLAWGLLGEPIGRRVALALGLMVVGGVTLTLSAASGADWSTLGALAVAGATAAWALDNTLSRGLSEQDPVSVVAAKGALGATLTGVLSLVLGEPLPHAAAAGALLACGATGYGLSLRLYLLAQRKIGAARTSSIFATSPFIGALISWALGDGAPGVWTAVSAALFGAGVVLHLTEKHRHEHQHPEEDHEHQHSHDDGHHDHTHEGEVTGEHTHAHHHHGLKHDHEHAPDIHHGHAHETPSR
jgi:drug/metabolite transporter (DMT)-like permease